jgi:hypothetical protein
MTFFGGGGSAFGQGRSAMFDGTASRSQILGRRYQPFANPFFDQASTYTPPTVKSLFGFCRFYHLTHGVINAINTKASEYPVTDLVIQHKDRAVVNKWEELLLGVMNYRVHQFEVNLDYYVYGNAFVSPSFPFRKKLICESCGSESDALESRPYWRFINHRFWLTCQKCGQTDFAKSRDDYYPKYSEVSLIRWNPENVQIFYNESTGRLDYLLDISPDFRAQIQMGRKDLVATTPEIFLDAIKMRRSLVFDRQEVFHLRRPSLSSANRGWGTPLLMPVMKDAFYVQVMKKAQEAVLLTHLVPQIFLFPQPATGGADPFTVSNLQNWRDHIRRELARQRMDPSYYGILPFPIGHQVIGENGRSLLLMPEIRAMTEMIAVGMGFPSDLVFGQGSYAGTSVSMRMLENFFLSNVHSQLRLLHWVIRRMGAFMNWPTPDARFKPFRMADDLQRQALMFQLNQAGKISDTTLLSYADLKVEDEADLQISESGFRAEAIRKQQLLQAEVQAEAQTVMAKAQAKAQAAMVQAQAAAQAPPPDPFIAAQTSQLMQPAGVPLDAAAAALAQEVKRMPEDRRRQYLEQLQVQMPEAVQMLQQQGMPNLPSTPSVGNAGGVPSQQQQPPGVDMRPQPEVLPPRR